MWTTRFFTEFKDDDQGLWRVDIQAPDYSGAPVRLTPAGNPLEWMSSGSESQTESMIGSTGTLRLLIETPEEMALFTSGGVLPTSALSRRVIVTRESIVVWVGYVQMQTFSQDWEAAPVEIELPLMDTVEVLSHIYIGESETAQTTMALMRSAYRKALQGDAGTDGYEVGGVTSTDFLRTTNPTYRGRIGYTSTLWSDAQVFPGYYAAADDKDRMSYADALEQILSPFGRLWQIGARWHVDRYTTETGAYIYMPNPNGRPTFVTRSGYTVPLTDISESVAGADNNQSVLPPPSKVTATYRPEDGVVDYAGDTVVELKADNIKSDSSSGATNVEWIETNEETSTHNLLRYLRIGNGNKDSAFTWPVEVVGRHHMEADYYQYRATPDLGEGTHYRSKVIADGLLSGNPGPWCQVVQNSDGWKVVEGQTLCMRRTFDIVENVNEQGHDYLLKQDIITLRILRELVTSDLSVLKLTMKMQTMQLNKDADFSGADHTQEIYHPLVQLFWSQTANGTPSRVYNYTTGGWDECAGYFFPDTADSPHMAPYDSVSRGRVFHIFAHRGYLSVRIYASGWTSPGAGAPTISYAEKYLANRGDADWFVVTDFKLEYAPWIGSEPVRLLDWDTSYRDEKEYEYNNGSEEVSLQFKTLAGVDPTPETMLAPRRGFCDDARVVVKNSREMVDIDAVQVTQADGIPGVTGFSLFSFNGAIYFPAAIGMTARDNTVRLKLIRTIEH